MSNLVKSISIDMWNFGSFFWFYFWKRKVYFFNFSHNMLEGLQRLKQSGWVDLLKRMNTQRGNVNSNYRRHLARNYLIFIISLSIRNHDLPVWICDFPANHILISALVPGEGVKESISNDIRALDSPHSRYFFRHHLADYFNFFLLELKQKGKSVVVIHPVYQHMVSWYLLPCDPFPRFPKFIFVSDLHHLPPIARHTEALNWVYESFNPHPT